MNSYRFCRETLGGILALLTCVVLASQGSVYAQSKDSSTSETSSAPDAKVEKKDAHDDHGTHGGAHHDPHDLSHANAGPNLMKPEEFKSDLAIYTFVVFMLLLALLTKFAWGPISEGLAKREQHIADMIAEAKHNQEKSEQKLQEYQQKIAAAQDETREMMAQARRDSEALKEKLVTEAQAAGQRERDRAVEDIKAAKNAALQEIAQKSVDSAVSLAGRILRKEVRPQDHAQLIRESLEKFPSSN